MTTKPRVLGIDPAPSKGLSVFDPLADGSKRYVSVAAKNARSWLRRVCADGPVLVGWDAPIVTALQEPTGNPYYERPIEMFLRKRAERRKRERRESEYGAGVSVQPFAGCPHWAISLDVLGHPLPNWLTPDPDERLPLLLPGGPLESGVMETHPALAIALLCDARVPDYKGKKSACLELQELLSGECARWVGVEWTPMPERVPRDSDCEVSDLSWDDLVDAQVSYLCVEAARQDQATFLGDKTGGFVVPKTERAKQLQREFEVWQEEQKDAGNKK